ncbi:MAG: enoyl-CoA hydratase/isomerase family protein [Acidimicrobiia bacterium]
MTAAEGERIGDVIVSVDGPVLRATIDRPKARNAINEAVLDGLEGALDAAEATNAKVVVLSGGGGTFCAGADLKLVGQLVADRKLMSDYVTRLANVADRLESGPFVSLAVVKGFALAGGCELLLACDLALASIGARIGDRHVEFGLAPGAGGSVRLLRALPKAQARYLLLTGEVITGDQAAEWGLVSRALTPSALDGAVEAAIARLAGRSGDSLRAVKRMCAAAGADRPVDEAILAEREIFLDLMETSPDVHEGLAAFGEGRTPRFET